MRNYYKEKSKKKENKNSRKNIEEVDDLIPCLLMMENKNKKV